MGGLLAADAATDLSIIEGHSRRIIGIVAFDVPFLGMHPHVVISGIASLFADEDDSQPTETEMNTHPSVTIVDEKVTDDWANCRKDLNGTICAIMWP